MKISDIITSRNNAKVKWAASLSEKKNRISEGAFIAEGEKLLAEALNAELPITHLFINDADFARISLMIAPKMSCEKYCDTEIIKVSKEVFDKISTEKSPEGVITVIKNLDFFNIIDIIYKEEFFSSDSERVIALCSVRDPGNLGTIIRSAVAFGFDRLVLSSDCADLYNPRTVRAAMGGLFKLRVSIVKDFHAFVLMAKESGRRVFAAELSNNAVSLSTLRLESRDIFIIGNEGHGIPKEISDASTASVYIPISENTESLNASIAASLLMWEQSKI